MRNPQLLTVVEVSSCGTAGRENGTVSRITLRDLAAIAAMQGLLTNSLPGTNCGVLAIDAVNYADALLAELEKQP